LRRTKKGQRKRQTREREREMLLCRATTKVRGGTSSALLRKTPPPGVLQKATRTNRCGENSRSVAASAGINLGNFGKVLQEKAKADFSKVFQGTEKTREKMGVVDELLAYWKLGDSEDNNNDRFSRSLRMRSLLLTSVQVRP
jgi:hypothetical protein